MPFVVSQCHHRTQDRFWTGQLSWMALGSSAGVNKLTCSSIDNKVLRLSYTTHRYMNK